MNGARRDEQKISMTVTFFYSVINVSRTLYSSLSIFDTSDSDVKKARKYFVFNFYLQQDLFFLGFFYILAELFCLTFVFTSTSRIPLFQKYIHDLYQNLRKNKISYVLRETLDYDPLQDIIMEFIGNYILDSKNLCIFKKDSLKVLLFIYG